MAVRGHAAHVIEDIGQRVVLGKLASCGFGLGIGIFARSARIGSRARNAGSASARALAFAGSALALAGSLAFASLGSRPLGAVPRGISRDVNARASLIRRREPRFTYQPHTALPGHRYALAFCAA